MKIKYEFADGTVSEVEVEESIGIVIIEDRRLEDNLTRKECYHCHSLDAAEFEGSDYGTEETLEMLLAAMEERPVQQPCRGSAFAATVLSHA